MAPLGGKIRDATVGAYASRQDRTVLYSSTRLAASVAVCTEDNVDNAMSSQNAALWMLVHFRYVTDFLRMLVDKPLDPEVIGKKRRSPRGNDAVVLCPCEDQVDGVTVGVCRLTDVLDNVNGVV